MKKITWKDIITEYTKNPRDVITVPQRGVGIWFYVYAEKDGIYIENAREHTDSSKIKGRRRLEQDKLEVMTDLHQRRKRGESVSKNAIETTYNQVYWYGILSDMGI